jgi:asparagine synthase (glutamine-hydrolysing)
MQLSPIESVKFSLDIAVYAPEAGIVEFANSKRYEISSLKSDRRSQGFDEDNPAGEASSIEIVFEDGLHHPAKVRFFRGISSGYEIFYAFSEGRLIVSDRFSHVIRELPAASRTADRAAVAEHFLFRVVTPPRTYCRGISRTPAGALLEIDLRTGETTRRQIHRVDALTRTDRRSDPVTRVERALEAAAADAPVDDCALLFSGGVDSTLAATLLPATPLAQSMIDSVEFAPEALYARRAAETLGRTLAVRTLPEAEYGDRLLSVVDRIGMPPHHAISIVIDHAMADRHARYVTGSEADVLFGFGNGYEALLAPAARTGLGRAAIDLLIPLARGRYRRRLQSIRDAGVLLAREVGSPKGMALGLKQPGAVAAMIGLLGEDEVEAAMLRRLDYVKSLRVPVRERSREPDHHIAICQLVNYFCSNTLSTWRQIALSRGKTLFCPYADARVLAVALSVPEARRYAEGRTVKHLLKKVLRRRAPSYPYDQTKLGGELPLRRYHESGPLRGLLERFPLPDFLPRAEVDRLAATDVRVLWHALTFGAWQAATATWESSRDARAVDAGDPVRWRFRSVSSDLGPVGSLPAS